MKLSKKFVKYARPDGRMVYRRKQYLPAGIKLRSIVMTLDEKSAAPREHAVTVSLDGAHMMDTTIRGGEAREMKFDPPMVIPRGQREVRTVWRGFEPMEEIAFKVEVDVSIALF